jgi:hypothetical protein
MGIAEVVNHGVHVNQCDDRIADSDQVAIFNEEGAGLPECRCLLETGRGRDIKTQAALSLALANADSHPLIQISFRQQTSNVTVPDWFSPSLKQSVQWVFG